MDSDLSPDTADAAASAAAKQRRLSTTCTLLGVVACVFLAKTLAIGAPAMPSTAAAPHHGATLGVTPVTIVAPEFCKNQTWPYIDARCLRRVDNPPPVEVRNANAAPVNTAAAIPAPVSPTPVSPAPVSPAPVSPAPVNPAPANPAPAMAPPAAASGNTAPEPPRGVIASASASQDGTSSSPKAIPAAAPSQVIQSVFPTAEPKAAPQIDLQSAGADTPAGATTYQRADNAGRPHPSRHGHHGFFPFGGFRF